MRFILTIGLFLLVCGQSFSQVGDESRIESTVSEYGGRHIRFAAPYDGQYVVAGDSLVIELVTDGGVDLDSAFVVFPGGMLMLSPPFKGMLKIPDDAIGEMELSALGTTSSGEMVSSIDIKISIGVGETELLEIVSEETDLYLLGPRCYRSLNIIGRYTDGVERNLTEEGAQYSVVEGGDVVCVTGEGVVIGRSSGQAMVSVAFGGHTLEIPVVVEDGDCGNNPPSADLASLIEATVGKRICIDASAVKDFDMCLGEVLPPDDIVWKVEFDDSTYEGRGFEFCFVPENVGDGLVRLEVTDSHGASSWTMSMIEVR